jgi:sugar/nucleoside kinase (ribokinase family)
MNQNDELIVLLAELKQKLTHVRQFPTTKQVFVGFDGFVDQIMKAIKQKWHYRDVYFETIEEFASRIKGAAGKSGQIEIVCERTKLGGNAPILANTLGRLGLESHCAGSLGYPERHSVFSEMHDKCRVISLANPGDSRAIEFKDGKIILSELSAFKQYDWNAIKNSRRLDSIRRAILNSDIVAFVDWANLPFASEIWEGVLDDVIKPSGKRDFQFFFDLCDPSRKTTEQIDEVLDLMSCFSSYGKVTVGLNENETFKIWGAINGIDASTALDPGRTPNVRAAASDLFKTMNVESLLVHPVDRTIVIRKFETIELRGRLVTQPKIQTGGGDNLNAGFFLGLLHGFTIRHCMLLGMATSGAYIQDGTSPDLNAIIQYIEVWIRDLEKMQPASNATSAVQA